MSVQLILYPQNYLGIHNYLAGNTDDVIADGQVFATAGSSLSFVIYNGTNLPNSIVMLPPVVPNRWYGTVFTPPAAAIPYDVAGRLHLTAFNGKTAGVYQAITVAPGVDYTITVTFANGFQPATYQSAFQISVRDNVAPYFNSTSSSTILSNNTLVKTFQVNSATPNRIFSLLHTPQNTDSLLCMIDSVTMIPTSGVPAILADGQVICDLYEDENIPLTLSVDEFKNAAENQHSYSKAFNLPGTKRNNMIFDEIFEVTRVTRFRTIDFNPYQKSQCILKQDGLLIFEGYLRLLDIVDKEGEISYNVNLYSEVITLADILKERTFSELDFSELDHDYQKENIKNSWDSSGVGINYVNPNTSGFRDDNNTVKYPFVDWNHNFEIANNPGGSSGPTDNNPMLGQLSDAFRPFINIKYLIDRIFNAPNTPFSYTSNFINNFTVKKLYMDFNWGEGNAPNDFGTSGESYLNSTVADNFAATTYSNVVIPLDNFSGFDWDADSGFDASTGVFTAQQDNTQYNLAIDVFLLFTGSTTVTIEWFTTTNGAVNTVSFSGNNGTQVNYTSSCYVLLNAGDVVFVRFIALNNNRVKVDNSPFFVGGTLFGTVASSVITTGSLLQNLRGETNQWEFLKGFFTMFNIIVIQDPETRNNLIIEPYRDIFGVTTQKGHNKVWTDKIDISEMKLEPLRDLDKTTIFKYEEDDADYAFTNYKNATGGFLYGSRTFEATNLFNILDVGEKEIIATPFAATVVKPLMSQYPTWIVPSLYSYNSDDDTSSGFDNLPRILYDNGVKSTGSSYFIPAQNGLLSENQSSFLQFSHLTSVPSNLPDFNFNFGPCQFLPGVGINTTNDLFSTFWLPYFNQLYDIDTRIMTIKVNLSSSDIALFKFNDKILIKNRVFRVNKIDYMPNELSTVEFILVGDEMTPLLPPS